MALYLYPGPTASIYQFHPLAFLNLKSNTYPLRMKNVYERSLRVHVIFDLILFVVFVLVFDL